jgi:hypothetical protein
VSQHVLELVFVSRLLNELVVHIGEHEAVLFYLLFVFEKYGEYLLKHFEILFVAQIEQAKASYNQLVNVHVNQIVLFDKIVDALNLHVCRELPWLNVREPELNDPLDR